MSKRAYFGTDGIRGQANKHPMTAEVALRVGLAAGKLFRSQDERRHLVVIGKDTRLSGYMIEPALVAGLTSVGMDVRLFGPLPTPAVAMMTRSMRADLGIMISASHNNFADNGIKLFGPDGYKLSDEQELKIEALMDEGLQEGLAAPRDLGRVKRIDDAQARYVEIVKATFPRHLSLAGKRIVLDCAHGAAYKVAPTALYELGAEVIALGVTPDGTNINEECGSTHPEAMAKMVREYRADIGIALDGDADRLVICDEKGLVVDGDQIMAIIAASFHAAGALKGGGVVATVMSNLGLERYLNGLGLKLERGQAAALTRKFRLGDDGVDYVAFAKWLGPDAAGPAAWAFGDKDQRALRRRLRVDQDAKDGAFGDAIGVDALRRAHQGGVRIAFGTDSAVSKHGENAREFALMVQAGLTPLETIKSATVWAATHSGLEAEIGTLAAGKSADIVAVKGDPLSDVRSLETMGFVMARGVVVRAAGE